MTRYSNMKFQQGWAEGRHFFLPPQPSFFFVWVANKPHLVSITSSQLWLLCFFSQCTHAFRHCCWLSGLQGMVKREWCVYQNWSQIFLGFLAFVQLVRLSGFSSLSPQLSSSSSLLCRLLFLLFFCRQVSFLSYRRDQSKGLPLLQRYSEAEKKEWFHVCMAFLGVEINMCLFLKIWHHWVCLFSWMSRAVHTG